MRALRARLAPASTAENRHIAVDICRELVEEETPGVEVRWRPTNPQDVGLHKAGCPNHPGAGWCSYVSATARRSSATRWVLEGLYRHWVDGGFGVSLVVTLVVQLGKGDL